MRIPFTKMQGCGNDYIYINCMQPQPLTPSLHQVSRLIQKISDRHFGVGADGVVFILPSIIADVSMRMYNQDGTEGNMCGNAIRCVAKYVYESHLVDKEEMQIETKSGIRNVQLTLRHGGVIQAGVLMGKPILASHLIPVNINQSTCIHQPLYLGTSRYMITCVSMGNPHAVVFCDDIEQLPIAILGPQFESHPLFPQHINTEFVRVMDATHLVMRVWERGSGETLACGTGACAAVVAATLNGYCQLNSEVIVSLPGGELTIQYTPDNVYMRGPCETVFEGLIEL